MPRTPQAVASKLVDEAGARLGVDIDPVDLAERVEEEAARLEGRIGADIHAVEVEAVEAGVEIDVGPLQRRR